MNCILDNLYEKPMPTPHSKLLLARSVAQDVDEIRSKVNGFAEAVTDFEEKTLLNLLRKLVPEFTEEKIG